MMIGKEKLSRNLSNIELRALDITKSCDLAALSTLRAKCFVSRGGLSAFDLSLDGVAQHYGVFTGEALVACFRIKVFEDAADLAHDSYCARYYDLTPLAPLAGRFVEIGRFCLDPDLAQAEGAVARMQMQLNAMRLCWGEIARLVLRVGAHRIVGCSSFTGRQMAAHAAVLALLAQNHLGPPEQRPRLRAGFEGQAHLYASGLEIFAQQEALTQLPPLLRFYLKAGAWVGDLAIEDADLDTLHVFTLLDLAALPPDLKASFLRLAALSA